MGKNPDQIERQIREQRDGISRRIEGLQHRVQEDVESVRAGAKQRANSALDQTKQKFDFESQVRDHPLTSVAGAFGVGVLLGAVTDSMGGSGGASPPQRQQFSNGGNSFMGGFLGSLWSMAGPTVQEEVRDVMKEAVSGLTGRKAGSTRLSEYEMSEYERSYAQA